MANANSISQSSPEELINGCQVIRALDLEAHFHISEQQASNLYSIFRAIERLSDLGDAGPEIDGLAAIGAEISKELGGSVDVMRERYEKAGVSDMQAAQRGKGTANG